MICYKIRNTFIYWGYCALIYFIISIPGMNEKEFNVEYSNWRMQYYFIENNMFLLFFHACYPTSDVYERKVC